MGRRNSYSCDDEVLLSTMLPPEKATCRPSHKKKKKEAEKEEEEDLEDLEEERSEASEKKGRYCATPPRRFPLSRLRITQSLEAP
mmetsp:Transcript_8906/g.28943  ORF Transcript_8906/g.28943 Transcript_8906/m.28943 type:complete len:85 (-) Transcript_8906:93-347(-)